MAEGEVQRPEGKGLDRTDGVQYEADEQGSGDKGYTRNQLLFFKIKRRRLHRVFKIKLLNM